jgi:HSP90 family molecular chaperone
MIEALRGLGYSTSSALADIIDNSIAAAASKVDIEFVWAGPSSYVTIVDDGHGMTAADLERAMRLGDRNPLAARAPGDLGRFGLGLKTASFSQCRRLTVASRQAASVSCLRWDLDAIAATGIRASTDIAIAGKDRDLGGLGGDGPDHHFWLPRAGYT